MLSKYQLTADKLQQLGFSNAQLDIYRRCNHGLEKFQRVLCCLITGSKTIEEIIKILKWDHDLRPLASEKLGITSDESSFYFGRPLTQTIKMFGLRVRREPDGSFFLTTSGNP